MREIKFRAWVTEYADKESPGYMIDLPANKLQFDCEDGFVLAFGDPGFWGCECYEKRKPKFEVMQFTGLKDKNGKDIYEGDIVEYDLSDGSKYASYVEWSDVDAMWVMQYSPLHYHANMTVIGNIYENPELLTNPPRQ